MNCVDTQREWGGKGKKKTTFASSLDFLHTIHWTDDDNNNNNNGQKVDKKDPLLAKGREFAQHRWQRMVSFFEITVYFHKFCFLFFISSSLLIILLVCVCDVNECVDTSHYTCTYVCTCTLYSNHTYAVCMVFFKKYFVYTCTFFFYDSRLLLLCYPGLCDNADLLLFIGCCHFTSFSL